MTKSKSNLNQAISYYGKTFKASSKKNVAKMVGYGAAAAGGLLTCGSSRSRHHLSVAELWMDANAAYAFDIWGWITTLLGERFWTVSAGTAG